MKHMLYLMGASGSGKSTLLREALLPAQGEYQLWGRHLHTMRYPGDAIILGRERETFSGTDTLSFSIHREAEAFLREEGATVVIGEGQRLSAGGFFREAEAAGYHVTVAYLDTPLEECQARARERGAILPLPTIKATATRAARLASVWTHPDWWLDGLLPKATLVARLREHPAIASIREAVGV